MKIPKDLPERVKQYHGLDKHEYPSSYPPGCHWAITQAWEILDSLPVGVLDISQRSIIAGMIAGALMKAKDD